MTAESTLVPSRRGFLVTLGAALVAAPAVVRAASIMPVQTPAVALRAPGIIADWDFDPSEYTPLDCGLTLDYYAQRILAPMIDNLQQQVAQSVMSGNEGGLANLQVESLSGELAVGDALTIAGRGNSLLTISMITREAVRNFKNSNKFIEHINSQYDSEFAHEGAKIGQTLRIRLPQDYHGYE